MLTDNFDLAMNILSNVEADISLRIGSQYLELKYLKKLYLAIIQKDELAFNKEIVRRIKTYRRNPYTHAVIIDFPTISLIKIATKYGVNYKEHVAEIPEMFLNDNIIVQPEQLELPFSDRISLLLGECN